MSVSGLRVHHFINFTGPKYHLMMPPEVMVEDDRAETPIPMLGDENEEEESTPQSILEREAMQLMKAILRFEAQANSLSARMTLATLRRRAKSACYLSYRASPIKNEGKSFSAVWRKLMVHLPEEEEDTTSCSSVSKYPFL